MKCRICLGMLVADADVARQAHARCLRGLFGTASVRLALPFSRSDMTGEMLARNTRRMSISGVQQKLSLQVRQGELQPTDVGGAYILKPTPEAYRGAAENEHLSMLLGRRFGIDTAACGLVEFADGERAYLTRRFDRADDGTRVHQEDMAQALGRMREETGEYKYDGSYEEVGRTIRGATGGKLAAVYDFFGRLLARFVVRDGDYHLKNISLWKPDARGAYAGLTPNYDMLNTGLYLPAETVLALDLLAGAEFTPAYERLGHYTWSDFAELARRIDLTPQAAERVRSRILGRQDDARRMVDASFLPDDLKEKYAAGMAERFRCLAQAG